MAGGITDDIVLYADEANIILTGRDIQYISLKIKYQLKCWTAIS